MTKNEAIAKSIYDAAKARGWVINVRNDLLEITKKFTPNDMDAFVKADGEYYGILGLLPTTRPGSIWGTDGGGVGALSAMKDGLFVMKKSGGNKLVLRKLDQMLY